jgi:UDP-N-acetylglucosamine diphosphorylase/glucosamine-1-phosphate N-acetyltransferase
MHLYLFEDNQTSNLFPLTYNRPVYDLRCGIRTLREKLLDLFPVRQLYLQVRPHLTELVQEENPKVNVNTLPREDAWFINGRLLADESFTKLVRKHDGSAKVFRFNDELAAAFLTKDFLKTTRTETSLEKVFADCLPHQQIEATMLHYPWEIVHYTVEEIERDFTRMKTKRSAKGVKVYKGTHLLNKKNILFGRNVTIKPGAVLDAEHGPIVIGDNVTILPNAYIEGPAYIGANSIIKVGAKIYHGTSIGEWCKVGGEVDNAVIHSYSNKQHEGFLGHSYIGSWVNIGADTNTSDLKNTYGNVKVIVNGQLIDSGSQFVGLTMGDQSKTGINMMFDTGSIVGVGCNLFGADLPPKFVPSFSWGRKDNLTTYDIEKCLETARRMMSRRNVQMTSAYEAMMRSVFAMTEQERKH